jgi:hypothetical protein
MMILARGYFALNSRPISLACEKANGGIAETQKSCCVIVGECKTYGEFKEKDFARMRYLAETFPGAILVFSTLRKSLNANEVTEITRIAKAGREHWKADRPINPVLIGLGQVRSRAPRLPSTHIGFTHFLGAEEGSGASSGAEGRSAFAKLLSASSRQSSIASKCGIFLGSTSFRICVTN